MNITLNNDLQNFLAFAEKANADQTAGMTQSGSVGNAVKTAGTVSRFFHATENFLNELVREFNADHPELALQ